MTAPDSITARSSTFPPIARAVVDAVGFGVVVFDVQGTPVYANEPARQVLNGVPVSGRTEGSDLRSRLAALGARFALLKTGGQVLGEAAFLPEDLGRRTLAERERQAILETLQGTKGKLAETARRLGISRTTLWRRLKAYGLSPFPPRS